MHNDQAIKTGTWQGLYLGSDDLNMAEWNSTYPPAYKYGGITAPVALFWGQNNWLIVPEDEAVLAEKLPNLILNQRVGEDAYTYGLHVWSA